jgi:hypothetical protein
VGKEAELGKEGKERRRRTCYDRLIVNRFWANAADVRAVLADGGTVGEEEEVGVVFDEVVAFGAAAAGWRRLARIEHERRREGRTSSRRCGGEEEGIRESLSVSQFEEEQRRRINALEEVLAEAHDRVVKSLVKSFLAG